MKNTICIYHGNCADGFGAAWVVRHALGEENVEFFPGFYGEAPPDVTDKDVIIVDFSYPYTVTLEMATKAKSILVIDHHKTAKENLTDVAFPANVTTIFDMDYSGAMLTWQTYFPHTAPPKLLQHIQDRDLWKFELNFTREIQAGLFSYEYDFNIWDELMLNQTQLTRLRDDGVAIERKHFKDVHELIDAAAFRLYIGGYSVPTLNAPYFYASDAGHIMAKDEDFAATYFFNGKEYVFSLRSNKENPEAVDVADIASLYGGGGHKHAAGFKLSPASFGMMFSSPIQKQHEEWDETHG